MVPKELKKEITKQLEEKIVDFQNILEQVTKELETTKQLVLKELENFRIELNIIKEGGDI